MHIDVHSNPIHTTNPLSSPFPSLKHPRHHVLTFSVHLCSAPISFTPTSHRYTTFMHATTKPHHLTIALTPPPYAPTLSFIWFPLPSLSCPAIISHHPQSLGFSGRGARTESKRQRKGLFGGVVGGTGVGVGVRGEGEFYVIGLVWMGRGGWWLGRKRKIILAFISSSPSRMQGMMMAIHCHILSRYRSTCNLLDALPFGYSIHRHKHPQA